MKDVGLLFDLDGTLLNNRGEVTEYTAAALQACAAAGYRMGVCTGRNYALIRESIIAPYFDASAVHITSNGARVSDGSSQTLQAIEIKHDAVQDLVNRFHTSNIFLHQENHTAVSDVAYDHYRAFKGENLPIIKLSKVAEYTATQVTIVGASRESLVAAELETELCWQIMQYPDGNWYADVTADTVTKATAFPVWTQETGVATENIIAFGNGKNDTELFEAAGKSVAVANADEGIKQRATDFTTSNDQDGVARYLYSLLRKET